ncbi:MAG: 23S rRNA (pseudouridine(1915)-N(3))-methyltransferase RlmH [Candidatus Wenzhouxiangella sp. M2_3B_020]
MKIRVVAIGRSMPDWLGRGWTEYARRMPRQIELELVEVQSPRGGSEVNDREGRALIHRAPRPGIRVALHERGTRWSTRDVADRLERWMMDGDAVSLLIGGASGHSDELLDACDEHWSLGPLTFPHMLVRVILAEQIYRAWTVVSGHPYHRA